VVELTDVLDRTTPDVRPPGLEAITRRARRRRTTRRIAFGVPVVLAVVAAIAVAVPRDGAVVERDAPPLGTWRAGADAPFSPRDGMHTAVTDDGRVVVVGNADGSAIEGSLDGGIYDPASDTWAVIPPAPMTSGGHVDTDIELVGDTLMVAATVHTGLPSEVASFDIASMAWSRVELPGEVGRLVEWSWDGSVLVLVTTDGEWDESSGPGPGAFQVHRWDARSRTWSEGAPCPLPERIWTQAASGDGRIALWGGSASNELGPVTGSQVPPGGSATTVLGPVDTLSDGAIYDIGDNTWSALPNDPLAAPLIASSDGMLRDGALVLVGGHVDGDRRSAMMLDDSGWHSLPAAEPAGTLDSITANDRLVVRAFGRSGPQPAQYLDVAAGVWRDAPAYRFVETDRGLVTTTATIDNPGEGPFQVWLLRDATWTPTVVAPFTNRMDPGLAAVGDLVIVFGGAEGPQIEGRADTWILQLTTT
jgi:hypothetical protein